VGTARVECLDWMSFRSYLATIPMASCPRQWGEPLIDCEEDRTLRAVLVGMLRERAVDTGRENIAPCRRSAVPEGCSL
jgi:hypothetical protein